MKLADHDEPYAPMEPPTSRDWDATFVDEDVAGPGEMPGLFSGEQNDEAPLAEELPEVPLIRAEEIIDDNDEHPEAHGTSSAFKANAAKKKQKSMMSHALPHAMLAASETSDAQATYASSWSLTEDEARSTEAPSNDEE